MSSKPNESRNGEALEGVVLTPEQERSRRARNIAIGVMIALLAVLFYAITVVRLGGAVANRAI
jgi:hypothetical protein